jgi:hypothetical protein
LIYQTVRKSELSSPTSKAVARAIIVKDMTEWVVLESQPFDLKVTAKCNEASGINLTLAWFQFLQTKQPLYVSFAIALTLSITSFILTHMVQKQDVQNRRKQ